MTHLEQIVRNIFTQKIRKISDVNEEVKHTVLHRFAAYSLAGIMSAGTAGYGCGNNVPFGGSDLPVGAQQGEFEEEMLCWEKKIDSRIVTPVGEVQQTSEGGYVAVGSKEVDDAEAGFIHRMWLVKLDREGNKEWDTIPVGCDTDTGCGGVIRERGTSIQETNEGGYIIVGNYKNEKGGVLKLNADRIKEWEKIVDDASLFSIRKTVDNGYVIGGTVVHQTPFLAESYRIFKISSEGHVLWEMTGEDQERNRVDVVRRTVDGGYIAVGWEKENLDYTSKRNTLIMKIDSNGNLEWKRAHKISDNGQYGTSIEQTAEGGYIVVGNYDPIDTGSFILKVNNLGETEWHKIYNDDYTQIYDVVSLSDGYLAVGNKRLDGRRPDGLLVKILSDGEIEWKKTFEGEGIDDLFSLQKTMDGGYIMAGTTAAEFSLTLPIEGEGSSAWFLKVNQQGNIDCR